MNIIRFMNSATEIMEKIEANLLVHKRADTPSANISKLCMDVRLALQLWSKAFSMMNKKDPTLDFCNQTQAQIDLAVKQMTILGLSVTPKVHGMSCHMVQQMRAVPGGIALMLEYWVEHYHQVAHRYDVYWKGMTDTQKQAETRARIEKMFRNPKVKREVAAVTAKYVGVRKQQKLEKRVEAEREK